MAAKGSGNGEKDKKVSLETSLDTSGFQTSLNKLGTVVDKAADKLGSLLNTFDQTIQGVKGALNTVAEAVREVSNEVGKASVKKLAADVKQTRNSVEKDVEGIKASLQSINDVKIENKGLTELEATVKRVAEAIGTVVPQQIEAAFASLKNRIEEMSAEMSSRAGQIQASFTQVTGISNTALTSIREFVVAVRALNRTAGKANVAEAFRGLRIPNYDPNRVTLFKRYMRGLFALLADMDRYKGLVKTADDFFTQLNGALNRAKLPNPNFDRLLETEIFFAGLFKVLGDIVSRADDVARAAVVMGAIGQTLRLIKIPAANFDRLLELEIFVVALFRIFSNLVSQSDGVARAAVVLRAITITLQQIKIPKLNFDKLLELEIFVVSLFRIFADVQRNAPRVAGAGATFHQIAQVLGHLALAAKGFGGNKATSLLSIGNAVEHLARSIAAAVNAAGGQTNLLNSAIAVDKAFQIVGNALRNYYGIRTNNSNPLSAANSQFQAFAQQAGRQNRGASQGASQAINRAGRSGPGAQQGDDSFLGLGALGRNINDILPVRGPLVQLTGLLFLLQGAVFGIERAFERLKDGLLGTNIALEQQIVSLTTTLGTLEKAKSLVQDFAIPFAAKVPFFEFKDVIEAVERLAAEGFGIREITGNLKAGFDKFKIGRAHV